MTGAPGRKIMENLWWADKNFLECSALPHLKNCGAWGARSQKVVICEDWKMSNDKGVAKLFISIFSLKVLPKTDKHLVYQFLVLLFCFIYILWNESVKAVTDFNFLQLKWRKQFSHCDCRLAEIFTWCKPKLQQRSVDLGHLWLWFWRQDSSMSVYE